MNAKDSCSRLKLLVAIDDSIPAQWALQTARKFASKLGAEIVVLTVIPPPEPVGPEAVFAGTQLDLHEQFKRDATDLLEKTKQSIPPEFNCQTILREGDPSAVVIALAEELNANMIVMGSRGRNRFAQFVLGSTAEGVIRGAKCPVLTISHEPKGCGCGKT